MAEKITIAELNIDDAALLKSTSDIKKAIDKLNKSQKELRKLGIQGSEAFVENAADLKVLKKEYNENVKAIASRTKSIIDSTNREKLLEIALNSTAESIEESREQTKLLTKLRNQTNVSTAQGAEELEKLNTKLDENTEFVKENADSYLKLKLNVGNYTESIKNAFDELNIFNGGLLGFIGRAEKAGGAGNLLKSSISAVSKSVLGLLKSTLAFMATPLGIFIAVLAGAFLLVKNAFNQTGESTNNLKDAFAAFSGIIKGVLKFLKPLGDFLINGLVVGLNLAEKAVYKTLGALEALLRFAGLKDLADQVGSFTKEIKETAAASRDLAKAERQLEKAQRKAQLIQLQYQKTAEKLRQIRDDESKTIAERIAANEELGVVLQNQLEEELKIAQLALEVAELRILAEGKTKEALDEQAEALTLIADIQERITGQESEQLVNRISLQKEAADKMKEIADKAIAQQRAELEVFIQSQGIRAKSLEQSLEIAKIIYRRETEILAAELANRNLTQTEYDAALLELKNDLLRTQAEAAIEFAQIELDEYIRKNQSKIDSDLYYSDESLRIEQERLNGLAEARREFEATRLAEGALNQQEYNAAINLINDENRIALEEAEAEREEAKAEKELIDLENKRTIDEENFLSKFEAQAVRLEAQRKQEVKAAEKSGADIDLINQKFAERKKTLDKNVQDFKIDVATSTLGNISQLAGKETAVGKAAAIAETTINTYKAATAAYSALAGITIVGPILGAIAAAAAVAAGVANVKKITSTKATYATGGIAKIEGARHSGGGVPIYAGNQYIGEAEGDEGIGILSRAAFGGFLDFNNSFNGGSSSNGRFEGGAVITQGIRPNNQSNPTEAITTALENVQFKVAVEDINDGQGSFAEIETEANV